MEHLCSDARKTLFFVKLLCGAYVCRSEPVLCPSPHSAVTPETSHRSKICGGGSSNVMGIICPPGWNRVKDGGCKNLVGTSSHVPEPTGAPVM